MRVVGLQGAVWLLVLSWGLRALGAPSLAEPSISPDNAEIAFVTGGDIWTVPLQGGEARILVSHGASESRPIYSPDGKRLAFISTRTGNPEVHVLELESGEVRRLTFDDGPKTLDGWSRSGRWIYYSTGGHDIGFAMNDIYRVNVAGSTPMPVVAERYRNEFFAAPRPDGKAMAFCAGGVVSREWWRKGGSYGTQSAIWLMIPGTAPTFEKLTPGGARELWPMWSPDGQRLYYVSDRSGHPNIRVREESGHDRQITSFTDGRLLWPVMSYDGKYIVFERDFALWLLDVATGACRAIPVKLRGAVASPLPEHHAFNGGFSEMALSPDGRKVAFIAHGEVFAASAREGGEAVRVTRSASIESHIAWARDSMRLAYVSNRDGRRHLYLFEFATGRERKLTDGEHDDATPRFSPDDKLLAFERDGHQLCVMDLANKGLRVVAEGLFERAPFNGRQSPYVWSPRGDYIAFLSAGAKRFENVYIVAASGEGGVHQVSFLPNTGSNSVSWSPDGTYLIMGTGHRTEDYQMARIDLIPRLPKFREDQLRDLFRETPKTILPNRQPPNMEVPRPAPATMPATLPSTQPATQPIAHEAKKEEPTHIVFDDIRRRLSLMPVGFDVDFQTISPDGKTLVVVASVSGQQNLYTISLDERSRDGSVPRQLTATAGGKSHVQFSPDSQEVYYLEEGRIAAASISARATRGIGVTAEMDVDFSVEKMAVFRQAWSYLRDQFCDPTFNGLDWNAVGNEYAARVASARTPEEVRRVMSFMVGELNASHMGVHAPNGSRASVGRLGLLFDRSRYESRGELLVTEVVPLGPGQIAGIKVGDIVLAVDGRRANQQVSLDEQLLQKIGKRVVLAVLSEGQKQPHMVPILPIDASAERNLMYRAWVEAQRAYVEKVSGGRLGYVHLADMTQNELARLNTDLDSETQSKEGVVVDVRNNTGGFVNGFAIDVFARRSYLSMKHRDFPAVPARTLLGQRALELPTVLVTNGHTYSDGEDFTEGYRALKLGKVVGEPTAGAVIFTSVVPLLDGSRISLPSTVVRGQDGVALEMHPRKVDVEVVRPVGETYTGTDSQLDAAVKVLLEGRPAPVKIATPATRPSAGENGSN